MHVHVHLIDKLLSFNTKFRAGSSSSPPTPTHEFTKKIPTRNLLIDKYPLEWASSKDIEDCISRAIEETATHGGILANEVYFCNELLYTDSPERTFAKNNEQRLARINGLTLDTRYIMWFVNLTPTPQSISNDPSGSHWCVLLVDFPDATSHASLPIKHIHESYPHMYARVRFFDPMGGEISPLIESKITRLLNDQLIGNVLRINFENYNTHLPENPQMNLLNLHIEIFNLKWKLQQDGVQCGIWCIWFAHQFMLTGCLDHTAWYPPPKHTDRLPNQLAFRRWYFSADDTKSVGQKRARDDDGHNGKRGGSSNRPIQLDSDDSDVEQ